MLSFRFLCETRCVLFWWWRSRSPNSTDCRCIMVRTNSGAIPARLILGSPSRPFPSLRVYQFCLTIANYGLLCVFMRLKLGALHSCRSFLSTSILPFLSEDHRSKRKKQAAAAAARRNEFVELMARKRIAWRNERFRGGRGALVWMRTQKTTKCNA